ncbi:MAG: transcription termination/antitermination factor NusG [Planctomycetota bacterium]|nr:MAG: transcription termination/antitermination factor NusG [Planctomycetota bacterium]
MARNWYVLRVQSGREDKVAENLLKKATQKELRDQLIQVFIPKEKITEIKGGKKRVREIKKYPGYVMVEVETDEEGKIPKELWYLIRETPGIGDFIGSTDKRVPQPMAAEEVEKLLLEESEKFEQPTSVKIDFQKGDKVKIKDGPFENFDGVVEEVDPQKGIVTVIVTIFGRSTPVELEYWEVEAIH